MPDVTSPLLIEPVSLRIPDACRFSGISRSTLYLLISRREIGVVKLGSSTLVLTQSLRDFILRRHAEQLAEASEAISKADERAQRRS